MSIELTTPSGFPRYAGTPNSAWRSCFWKDWRSCYPMVAIILLGVFAIQIALLLLGTYSSLGQRDAKWFAAQYTCLVGPVMVTIACVSMLIGREREERTWIWTSSLPVSWHISLASKALVTALCALVSLIVLMLLPLIAIPSSVIDRSVLVPSVFLTMVSCVELFLFVGLFLLLMHETIPAIIAGLVSMLVCQLAVAGGVAQVVRVFEYHNQHVEFYHFVVLLALSLLMVLVVSFATILSYRWRWLMGVHTKIGFTWVPSWLPLLVPRLAIIQAVRWTPTPNFTLVSLAWSQSVALRLAAVGLFVACTIVFALGQLSFILFFPLATILGVATFSGDQTKNRFRFLADRGVTPWSMLLSRFCPSAVVAIALACILLWILNHSLLEPVWPMTQPLSLALYVLLFLLSALATICFRSTLLTLSMSTMTAVGLAVFIELARIPSLPFESFEIVFLILALWYAMTVVSLTYLLVRWTRRWLTLDRNHLEWRFLVLVPTTMLGCVVPAAILSATFGFLMLPSYKDSGVELLSLSELEALVEPQVDLRPTLEAARRFNDPGLVLLMQVLDPRSAAVYQSVGNHLRIQASNSPSEVSSSDELKLEQLENELHIAEDAFSLAKFRPDNGFLYSIEKKKLVLRYLLATKLAFLKDNEVMARQAFNIASKLLRSEDSFSSIQSAAMNNSIWQILCTLKDSDMEQLGLQECKAILDWQGRDQIKSIAWQSALANGSAFVAWMDDPNALSPELRRTLGNVPGRPMSFTRFPPIRWYFQRNSVRELSSFRKRGVDVRLSPEREELQTRIESLLARSK